MVNHRIVHCKQRFDTGKCVQFNIKQKVGSGWKDKEEECPIVKRRMLLIFMVSLCSRYLHISYGTLVNCGWKWNKHNGGLNYR